MPVISPPIRVACSLRAWASCLAAFLVEIVTAQPQDVGEDLLAFARGLDGEGVGPALEQEGRVDEGLVVEAQGADDLRLALDQAAVVEELPFARTVWSRAFSRFRVRTG